MSLHNSKLLSLKDQLIADAEEIEAARAKEKNKETKETSKKSEKLGKVEVTKKKK